MSFERYVENSWLRREPTSAQEIADQFSIVSRSMADASVEQISDDLRFYTSFNAILALATAALRASGYRMTNQYGHHGRLIETLEFSIGADPRMLRKLQAFSRKRNAASYDSAGSVSNQELHDILATAEALRDAIERWIQESHPEFSHTSD